MRYGLAHSSAYLSGLVARSSRGHESRVAGGVLGNVESVEMWRDEVGEIERDVLSLKRQRSIFTDEPAVEKADAGMLMPADKKPKIPGRESEEVMSGAWRARRRL